MLILSMFFISIFLYFFYYYWLPFIIWYNEYVKSIYGGNKMKVLVAGGAGYIGSHICVELLQANHEVIVIDDFSNSKPEV